MNSLTRQVGTQPPGGTFDSSQRLSLALRFKHCNVREDLAQDTPIPEEWHSSLDFLPKSGTVLPEQPLEEGLAHCRSERS